MSYDGIVTRAVVTDIKNSLLGGRIYKIYQPEKDEIILVVKNKVEGENKTFKLRLSANASLPIACFTTSTKENPMVAPNFCMLLRKHIGNGRIVDVYQKSLERIIELSIEHLDEMGDICHKKLITEIMGKHSNVIFAEEDGTIIDAIKHISFAVSSVREVLPGRAYEYPLAEDKLDPLTIDINTFHNHILTRPLPVAKAIYTGLVGFSPLVANEVCYRAGIDGNLPTDSLTLSDRERVYESFETVISAVKNEEYLPCIAYEGFVPKEFSVVNLTSYGELKDNLPEENTSGVKQCAEISQAIEGYFAEKETVSRIKQKSVDLRKIVANAIARTKKKYDLQLKQLKDTENREKFKIYGELLSAYGYGIEQGAKEYTCENYYTNEMVTIPLDDSITPIENAKKYYDKYAKQKRTYEALIEMTENSNEELKYLLSVQNSLEASTDVADLNDIKAELVESGYIRGKYGSKNAKDKANKSKSKPLHFVSSDGYDIFVGKNNYQNDNLTFKIASADDMWFHAKGIAGSHVIVRCNKGEELPDRVYEEAASLAAYYSENRTSDKVEIDYTKRKEIKKPPHANPGYVIYHTNYSMVARPMKDNLTLVSE